MGNDRVEGDCWFLNRLEASSPVVCGWGWAVLAVITDDAAMLRYEGRGLACLSKDYLELDR